jgi:hypothetical protein
MSALITSVEHALAKASDMVKVAKFVDTQILPVGAGRMPAIEAVTSLVSPQAANIERAGFAVLGLVIKALDDAGAGWCKRPQRDSGRAARRGHQEHRGDGQERGTSFGGNIN